VKNGRLVYAKGYGYANKESFIKVDTTSLFRIASLSKTITAIGIMQLIEKGKLSMDDKVFGKGGILGTEYGTPPYPEYVEEIKLKHLLHHTTGGWGRNPDPAFSHPKMNADQIISWVIDNRPLKNPPGTQYLYSNFGYIILGK